MSWQPIWITNCIDRAPRQAKDEGQFCVECFPVHAITYGEAAEEQRDELRNKGFEVFDLSAHEKGKPNVTYAKKDTLAR